MQITSINPLLTLSPELLEWILGYLQPHEVINLRLTSRGAPAVFDPYIFEQMRIDSSHSNQFLLFRNYGPLVRKLWLRNLKPELGFFFFCKYLVELGLVNMRLTEAHLTQLVKDLPYLRTLKVRLLDDDRLPPDPNIYHKLSQFTKLTRLELIYFEPSVCQYLFYQLPNLISFKVKLASHNLNNHSTQTNFNLINPNLKYPNYRNYQLKTLRIEAWSSLCLDTKFIILTPNSFPNLEEVALINCVEFEHTWLTHHWPKVTSVSLHAYHPKSLSHLVKNFPRLTRFQTNAWNGGGSSLQTFLTSLPFLTSLHIESSFQPTIFREELVKVTYNLMELQINFFTLDFEVLLDLQVHFPNLQTISLGIFQPKVGFNWDYEPGAPFPWKKLTIFLLNEELLEVIRRAPRLTTLEYFSIAKPLTPTSTQSRLITTHPNIEVGKVPSLSFFG